MTGIRDQKNLKEDFSQDGTEFCIDIAPELVKYKVIRIKNKY